MDILTLVISLFTLLFAVTIHEASHGWAALKMGDPTAYSLGRVSLNPIVHLDLFGSFIVPVFLYFIGEPVFGWAKPVPVNPHNLRNARRDNLWVSLAGPASNLAVAFAGLVLIRVLRAGFPRLTVFLRGFLQTGFRLPPGLYPLEGLGLILFYLVLINAYLAVFNLIPVPPLDGSGILSGLLSDRAAAAYESIRPYGFFIVIALIAVGFLNIIKQRVELFIKVFVFF